MLTTLIALFVGLGGGGGIASLINTFLGRRTERTKIDLDEDKFTQDALQRIIENLWKDNDTLRVSDELKTQRIRALEESDREKTIKIQTLEDELSRLRLRFENLEKGYNGS